MRRFSAGNSVKYAKLFIFVILNNDNRAWV